MMVSRRMTRQSMKRSVTTVLKALAKGMPSYFFSVSRNAPTSPTRGITRLEA